MARFPFGPPDLKSFTGGPSSISLDITDGRTIVDVDTVSQALSIDLNSLAADLGEGDAEVIIILRADSTGRTVSFGTGIVQTDVSQSANGIDVVHLISDKNGDLMGVSAETAK